MHENVLEMPVPAISRVSPGDIHVDAGVPLFRAERRTLTFKEDINLNKICHTVRFSSPYCVIALISS